MIKRIQKNILDVQNFHTLPLKKWQAAILLLLTGLIGIGVVIYQPIALIQQSSQADVTINLVTFFPLIAVLSFCIAVYNLLHRGNLELASWLFLTGLLFFFYNYAQTPGNLNLVFVIPVLMGSSILGWRGLVFAIAVIVVAILTRTLQFPEQYPTDKSVLMISILTMIGVMAEFFFTSVRRIIHNQATDINRLEDISKFSIQQTDFKERDQIFVSIIELLQKTFNIPFAQIYLFGDDARPNRRIRTGLGLERGLQTSQIDLSQITAIRRAGQQKTTFRVDPKSDPTYKMHLLPSTLHALAVPVVYDNTVIAVLDIQTSSPHAFSRQTVESLNILAGHLAQMLVTTQQMQEMRSATRTQNQTIEQLRHHILGLRQAESQNIQATWNDYLNQRGNKRLGFDLYSQNNSIVPSDSLPQQLRETAEKGELSISKSDSGEKTVYVPIKMQDTVIGVMSFTLPENRSLSANQVEIIQHVASRLALALENKRLYLQSQAQAQRETKANEISNLLMSSTDIETVLQNATNSFNATLGAVQTRVYLHTPEQTEQHSEDISEGQHPEPEEEKPL